MNSNKKSSFIFVPCNAIFFPCSLENFETKKYIFERRIFRKNGVNWNDTRFDIRLDIYGIFNKTSILPFFKIMFFFDSEKPTANDPSAIET